MNIFLLKKINIYLLIVLLVSIFYTKGIIYATNIIESNDELYNNIDDSLWEKINVNKNIAVTGDSYAGVFCEYESDNPYYKIEQIARSGKTIIENVDFIVSALNSEAKYVLLAIGPNDYTKQTSIIDFENYLRLFASIAKDHHKILFFHTYMQYPNKYNFEKSIKDYDAALRKIANESKSVYYIDMSDYEEKKFMRDDNLHYANTFNNVLFYRIVETIVITGK